MSIKDIVFVINTYKGYHESRLLFQLNTWMKNIPINNILIVTDEYTNIIKDYPFVKVKMENFQQYQITDFLKRCFMTFQGFMLSVNYLLTNHYDKKIFLFLDDDMFVNIDRLLQLYKIHGVEDINKLYAGQGLRKQKISYLKFFAACGYHVNFNTLKIFSKYPYDIFTKTFKKQLSINLDYYGYDAAIGLICTKQQIKLTTLGNYQNYDSWFFEKDPSKDQVQNYIKEVNPAIYHLGWVLNKTPTKVAYYMNMLNKLVGKC